VGSTSVNSTNHELNIMIATNWKEIDDYRSFLEGNERKSTE
jgi:hypothetical protein